MTAGVSFLNCGGGHAIASWGPLTAEGHWVWRLKQRQDQPVGRSALTPPGIAAMNTPAHMQTLSGTPSTLGRFELKKVLGRGAQAGVWLAHDPRLQRDVALKLLHSPSDGSGMPGAQQWLQEARNTSRLAHPHIVTLFEADVRWPAGPGA